MIFEQNFSSNKNVAWTIFHVILGWLSTISPFALIFWFYFVLFDGLFKLFKRKEILLLLVVFSYLISFEVLDRMAETSPYIPYELGKYMLLVMSLMGVWRFGIRSIKGVFMVLLIIPAAFYDVSQVRISKDIISYLLAPLTVGLGLSFADKVKITEHQLNFILKLIYWSCLSSLIFTILKTPDFSEIEFDLGANFDTTGGHASNQVSTILGLGLFLSFYSVYNRKLFSGNYILDISILIAFSFQGLLTFSRGGMLVGVFCAIILVLTSKIKFTKIMIGVLIVFVLFGSFNYANSLTSGNLLLRYQGETQGTLVGNKEKDLNNIVTGRLNILEEDLDLWLKYPIFGAGVGASTYLRDDVKVASHVELSRLLADHGIFGLIYSILFFGMFFQYRSKVYSGNSILYILIIFALLTTFHAAMRTFVTPLFVILGSLRFYNPKIA
jgi:hypothetical protein